MWSFTVRLQDSWAQARDFCQPHSRVGVCPERQAGRAFRPGLPLALPKQEEACASPAG